MPRHSETNLAAIKHAVDLVTLVGESLTLHRAGSKFKALCPFHDDHNPSLELNPERQSYKCWSCGAGGDVFDFVQNHERVDFPEAVRMLAERAGVALESPVDRAEPRGPSKADLLGVHAWAEDAFRDALARSDEALAYVEGRGISAASVGRFGLGFAPDAPDWLTLRAKREGVSLAALEAAGLVVRHPETGRRHERFRGRLIFPIRDLRGRPIAFGGRILPEAEKRWTEQGRGVAKYLNSPETPLFHKRRQLYATDLARPAARAAGWVAVVEGYTDVIAAHQAGLANVVGTLGTALGDDHVVALRRLADRVVLIFDGDDAGQRAADRSLELFLGHEVDVRVLSLPTGLDPADFLQRHGADALRGMIDRADDPLTFAIDRAEARYDFASPEGARQAAEAVLEVLARVPVSHRAGLDVKVGKALDALGRKLGLSAIELKRSLQRHRRRSRPTPSEPAPAPAVSEVPTLRATDLDPIDRELVQIVLNEPSLVAPLAGRVPAGSLRDAPLRAILQACYDLHREGRSPTFDLVLLRLDEPAVRSLASGLLLPADPAPLPERAVPAPWDVRLAGALARLDDRRRDERLRDLKGALEESDVQSDPVTHRSLLTEYLTLLNQRPGARKLSAS